MRTIAPGATGEHQALVLTNEGKAVFEATLRALSDFKRVFKRDVTPGFIAELYAARQYELELLAATAAGADATDSDGKRYQIKYRSPEVLNIDINNFTFDYIVLVNMDADYNVSGTWRLTVEQARGMCAHQEKFRKFQVSQKRFKAAALQEIAV
jgi:hypothetical protein